MITGSELLTRVLSLLHVNGAHGARSHADAAPGTPGFVHDVAVGPGKRATIDWLDSALRAHTYDTAGLTAVANTQVDSGLHPSVLRLRTPLRSYFRNYTPEGMFQQVGCQAADAWQRVRTRSNMFAARKEQCWYTSGR